MRVSREAEAWWKAMLCTQVSSPSRLGQRRTQTTPGQCPRTRESEGFLLVEAVFALVLLALVLLPVAFLLHRLGHAALLVEDRLVSCQRQSFSEVSCFGWGPQILEVTWTSLVTVEVAALPVNTASGLLVGVWKDGWFVAERAVGVDGHVTFGPDVVEGGATGPCFVFRARTSNGPWGPPWYFQPKPQTQIHSAENEPEGSIVVHGRWATPFSVRVKSQGNISESTVSECEAIGGLQGLATVEVGMACQVIDFGSLNAGGLGGPIHVYY